MTTAPCAGLSLKPQHYDEAWSSTQAGLWFEVHAENYMVAGGPRLTWLEAIRARHGIALHGVGLSLAGAAPPDPQHLRRLSTLVDRIAPAIVSEHLAWSTWQGAYYPDLLPFPRSSEALHRIVENIDRTQDALRRPILIENPSHYLHINGHDYDEIDFIAEIARRSGCGLLLDVNNVFVSARNLGFDAQAYIDAVPAELVHEIHLAGHSPDPMLGAQLLIDTHDAPVCSEVWALHASLIARIGARATLIERDGNVPAFEALLAERERAQALLNLPQHACTA